MTAHIRSALVLVLSIAPAFASAPEPLRWQWQDHELTYTLTSSIQGTDVQLTDPVAGYTDIVDLQVALRLRCWALNENKRSASVTCAIDDIGLSGTSASPARGRDPSRQELATSLARWEEALRGEPIHLRWGHDGELRRVRLPAAAGHARVGSRRWGGNAVSRPMRELLVPVLAALDLTLPEVALPTADGAVDGSRWVQRDPLAMIHTVAMVPNANGEVNVEHTFQARDGDLVAISSHGFGTMVAYPMDNGLPPEVNAQVGTHYNVRLSSDAVFDEGAGRLVERTVTTEAASRLWWRGRLEIEGRSGALTHSTQRTRVQLVDVAKK